MKNQLYLQLKDEAQIEDETDGTLRLSCFHKALSWKSPNPKLKRCLQKLATGSLESSLSDFWISQGKKQDPIDTLNQLVQINNTSDLPMFFYNLETLKKGQFLDYHVRFEEGSFLKLCCYPESNSHILDKPFQKNAQFQLSRFVYLVRENKALICKTPLASLEIHLIHPFSMHLFHALAEKKSISELTQELPQIPEETLKLSLFVLQAAQCLSDVDEHSALKTWEFHDLVFHTKSRSCTFPEHVGGTFRFLNKLAPLPALTSPPQGKQIPLTVPDVEKEIKEGPSFFNVLEHRKSIRDHGENPITKQELGNFLFYTHRVKQLRSSKYYEATQRPYPGGGACYELELYPLIYQCEGIEQGLYYYHPKEHALYPYIGWNEKCFKLLEDAKNAQGTPNPSQVLMLITARFKRVNWKYETMAYSVILKNTGVLIQTMYLVATAMNLAPCGVGTGDSAFFSKLTGKDGFEETTVGEFTLNSKTTKEKL